MHARHNADAKQSTATKGNQMNNDENLSTAARDRVDFLAKVKSRQYKTAELVDGNGFVSIIDSTVCDFGCGPTAAFAGYFCGQFQIWTESDLKNFCF